MKVKVFQIHKRSSYIFKDIQDKYAIQNNIYAISDGATQGFMSQIWAEQLVNSFVSNPGFNIAELIHRFKNLAQSFNGKEFNLDTNPAIKAIQERKKQEGASATFMGIRIEENNLQYISSGDVCGVIKKKEQLQFFPFQSVEALDKDKGFLGTQKEVEVEQFKTGNIAVYENDTVVLMTDAIARLALKKKSVLDEILTLSSFEDFKLFIINLWETKQLEEDDITIMCIENTNENTLQEFLAADLEFPKEKLPDLDFGSIVGGMTVENYYRLQNEINHLKNEIYRKDRDISRLEQYIAEQKRKIRLVLKVVIAIILGCILGIGVFYLHKKVTSFLKGENTESKIVEKEEKNTSKLIIPQNIDAKKKEKEVKNHTMEELKSVSNQQESIQSEEKNERESKNKKMGSIVESVKNIFNKTKDSISSLSQNKENVKNDEVLLKDTIKTKQK